MGYQQEARLRRVSLRSHRVTNEYVSFYVGDARMSDCTDRSSAHSASLQEYYMYSEGRR